MAESVTPDPGQQVYLIAGGGLYKIGTAADPVARLRDLQACSPAQLRLVASGPGGYDREAAIHHEFKAMRRHGEWFDLTGAAVAYAVKLVEGRAEFRKPRSRQQKGKSKREAAARAKSRERKRAAGLTPRDGGKAASRVVTYRMPGR